jgi:hypothetical protein
MKFNRLGAFTLGVVITAVSVGAVSFVDAAGNGTLKACANKTTGVMRYIAKGSCKKTETTLSWNQMGSQGLPGASGTNGTAGAKGDTGAAGTNGQNLFLIDGQDRQIGMVLGSQGGGNTIEFMYEGGLWSWSRGGALSGTLGRVNFFSDSACTTNLYYSGDGWFLPTDRGWNLDDVNPRYVKPTGNRIATDTTLVYGKVRSGTSPNFVYTCTISNDPSFVNWFRPVNTDDSLPTYLTEVVEVAPPSLTPPLRIVSK